MKEMDRIMGSNDKGDEVRKSLNKEVRGLIFRLRVDEGERPTNSTRGQNSGCSR